MNSKRVKRWSLLLLASLPLGVSVASDAVETPGLELLEFLGSWETNDGEFLDPIELLDELEAEPQKVKAEEQKNG
jgi:hypothetical protein